MGKASISITTSGLTKPEVVIEIRRKDARLSWLIGCLSVNSPEFFSLRVVRVSVSVRVRVRVSVRVRVMLR